MTSTAANPSPPRKRRRAGTLRAGITLPVLALSLALPTFAIAQDAQGSGNRHFKQAQAQSQASGSRHFTSAPVPKDDGGQDSIRDMIGISTNAAFFTAVAMIALFWFTVGGGRRAKKLGRQE
jgi:hypothetical protein